MNKNLIGKVFLIILGLLFLISFINLFIDRYKFVSQSINGTGTVISFGSGYLGDIKNGKIQSSNSQRPIVRFVSNDGRDIVFVSATGGNLIRRYVNQTVRVKYSPGNPEIAEIDEFLPLWGYVVIVFLLGITTFSFGMILLLVPIINRMIDKFYIDNGQCIESENVIIDCNYKVSSLGMHPFKIIAEGINPINSEKTMFTSHTIWGNIDKVNIDQRNKIYFLTKNGKYRFIL